MLPVNTLTNILDQENYSLLAELNDAIERESNAVYEIDEVEVEDTKPRSKLIPSVTANKFYKDKNQGKVSSNKFVSFRAERNANRKAPETAYKAPKGLGAMVGLTSSEKPAESLYGAPMGIAGRGIPKKDKSLFDKYLESQYKSK